MSVHERVPTDRDVLRAAALRLTTGVSVLTVADGDVVHGATVSSVSLVSRNPMLICAGLRQGSALSVLARQSGWFAVNVLSERQALVADWFASSDRPSGEGQFALVGWNRHEDTGIPLLHNALAALICRVDQCVPAGDHDLLLGEIVEGSAGVGGPLINFEGALYGTEFRGVTRRRSWRAVATTTATNLD